MSKGRLSTNPEANCGSGADAVSPWVLDVPLAPAKDGLWTNKFIDEHRAPVGDVTRQDDDGIRYLLPEIVLAYKARLRRPKDEPDFEATLPTLTPTRREWLRDSVRQVAPDHHWLDKL